MTLMAIILLAQAASQAQDPGENPQEDHKPFSAFAQEEDLETSEFPLLDLRWVEVLPRGGIALFGKDFDSDPSPCLSLMVRAPMPWLNPSHDPGGEYLGLYGEIGWTKIDRTHKFEDEDFSGTTVWGTLGIDYTFARRQSWFLRAHAGMQYWDFGNITAAENGFAPVAGLTGGMELGSGLSVTLGPEVSFGGSGDEVYLTYVGLMISF